MSSIQIFNKETLSKIEEQIKDVRINLHKDRTEFWKRNKKDFEENIKFLVNKATTPRDWKIYTIASHFVTDEEIMPYGYDSWSCVLLIAATKKQGQELLLFYNEARIGFLSLPALLPLVTHELLHTHQAAASPKKYSSSAFNDSYGSALETEVESGIHDLPKIFLQEAVLESVLYCYDKKGWNSAQKMIDFLYKDRIKLYTGGYLPWLTQTDHEAFSEAKRQKNISVFINYYFNLPQ